MEIKTIKGSASEKAALGQAGKKCGKYKNFEERY
jgi:hypothetical protein